MGKLYYGGENYGEGTDNLDEIKVNGEALVGNNVSGYYVDLVSDDSSSSVAVGYTNGQTTKETVITKDSVATQQINIEGGYWTRLDGRHINMGSGEQPSTTISGGSITTEDIGADTISSNVVYSNDVVRESSDWGTYSGSPAQSGSLNETIAYLLANSGGAGDDSLVIANSDISPASGTWGGISGGHTGGIAQTLKYVDGLSDIISVSGNTDVSITISSSGVSTTGDFTTSGDITGDNIEADEFANGYWTIGHNITSDGDITIYDDDIERTGYWGAVDDPSDISGRDSTSLNEMIAYLLNLNDGKVVMSGYDVILADNETWGGVSSPSATTSSLNEVISYLLDNRGGDGTLTIDRRDLHQDTGYYWGQKSNPSIPSGSLDETLSYIVQNLDTLPQGLSFANDELKISDGQDNYITIGLEDITPSGYWGGDGTIGDEPLSEHLRKVSYLSIDNDGYLDVDRRGNWGFTGYQTNYNSLNDSMGQIMRALIGLDNRVTILENNT